VSEVEAEVAAIGRGGVDWVTFVGSGETTLEAGLGDMIRGVRDATGLPIAVITNGSLLYRPTVRRELAAADVVLPSLDAGNAALFRSVNRPHPSLDFERVVDGLIRFAAGFDGRVWLEVMLVAGLNDSPAALREIAGLVAGIRPDAVHLNVPTRPPAEPWVRPPGEAALRRAAAILGPVATVVGPAGTAIGATSSGAGLPERIRAILARHPMSVDELQGSLPSASEADIRSALTELVAARRVRPVRRLGREFWAVRDAAFGDDSVNRPSGPPGSSSR
jgi:wyosine [tRNA(Phe)-imidazoG37] synthetase (radical SAM superfamily)